MQEIVLKGMGSDGQAYEHLYRAGRLEPMKALHVARRLLPIMGGMESIFAAAMSDEGVNFAQAIAFVKPVTEALASMPDEQVEYIINACLGAVQRRDGDRWFPVAADGILMYHDLKPADFLQLAGAVIRENIESFFPGRGSTSGAESGDEKEGQALPPDIPTLRRSMRGRS